MSVKTCSKCGEEKPLTEYRVRSGARDGRTGVCKSCRRAHEAARNTPERAAARREYARQWYLRNKRDPADARRYLIRLRYRLTPESFDALIESQGGVCPICKKPPPNGVWHVDHDHSCCPGVQTCGKCVRAALCPADNQGLGQFNDDPVRLRAAADYLESYRWNESTPLG